MEIAERVETLRRREATVRRIANLAISAGTQRQGPEASAQYGCLSRGEHERQLVGESFTLSLNDSAIFLRFFGAIDYFDGLPRCNMRVPARAEHSVQHAAYSAQRITRITRHNPVLHNLYDPLTSTEKCSCT